MSEPMGDEGAFLRAVRDEPDDEATRSVFADWLEERGNARAEFVRLDAALRKMTGVEDGFQQKEDRWRQLREDLPRAWLLAFGHLFTAGELRDAAATSLFPPPPLDDVDWLCYGPEMMIHPEHEYRILFFCGKVEKFGSALEFWLLTVHREFWGRHAISATIPLECRALSQGGWRKASAEVFALLRDPPALNPARARVPYVAGLTVKSTWRRRGWLASFQDVFVGLYCETMGA
jgi:uncharacterized protein (TIGR02996 family)